MGRVATCVRPPTGVGRRWWPYLRFQSGQQNLGESSLAAHPIAVACRLQTNRLAEKCGCPASTGLAVDLVAGLQPCGRVTGNAATNARLTTDFHWRMTLEDGRALNFSRSRVRR